MTKATARNILEDMFVGSLIATLDQPTGFSHFMKLDIQPEQISDKQNRLIFQAVRLCQNKYKESPTPENLVNVMAIEGMLGDVPFDINDAAVRRMSDIKNIESYTKFAARDSKAFNTIEMQLNVQYRERILEKFAKQDAPAIVNDPIGSLPEKANALQEALTIINSGWQPTSSVYYQPDQEREFREFVTAQRHSIADKQKVMTLPPEWGKLATTCAKYIKKGLLYVVKGPYKGGKSSAMGQWADWNAQNWKTAYFALEDDIARSGIRQVCRNIPGADSDVLYRGDPNNDFEKMIKLRQVWQKKGGNFIFVHCAGRSAAWIVQQINNIQSAFGLDMVFIDYLQKLSIKGDNETRGQAEAVEILKQRAEEPGRQLAIVLGSQVTVELDGSTHTYGGRAAEAKAQCIIAIRPKKAKEDEIFGGRILAAKGEMSVYSDLAIELYNDGQPGAEEMIFQRPKFKFISRDWKDRQNVPVAAPILTSPSSIELERIAKIHGAWDAIL